jgi:hypothetical protein
MTNCAALRRFSRPGLGKEFCQFYFERSRQRSEVEIENVASWDNMYTHPKHLK